jgi:hypothetical protein
MYINVYIYIHIYKYLLSRVAEFDRSLYVYIYVYIYINIYIYKFIYIYVYIYIYMYTYLYTCIYIYTYKQIFIYSYILYYDRSLLQAVSDALLSLSNCVPLEELSNHLDFMRSCVNSTGSDARHRYQCGTELYVSYFYICLSKAGSVCLKYIYIYVYISPCVILVLLNIIIIGSGPVTYMWGAISCCRY